MAAARERQLYMVYWGPEGRRHAEKIRNYCRSERPPFLVTIMGAQMKRERLR